MGGENPYIQRVEAPLPTRPFTLRFLEEGTGAAHEVRVDPADLPARGDGRPGSLLRYALRAGIHVDHACGGVCACSTCHVILKEGGETANEASEDEEDMLDHAPGLTSGSRLACQCVPDGSRDVSVVIPAWNRNLAQEGG